MTDDASSIHVQSPGKLFLCGEYGVLRGAPAIVASVDRYVLGTLATSDVPQRIPSLTPEAQRALDLAQAALGPVDRQLTISTDALREGGLKLGLGSSAGSAAVAAGAVFEAHGRSLGDAATLHDVYEIALDAHHAVSPNGSGADVASAVFGGVIEFQRGEERPRIVQLAWPSQLYAVVVWTRSPASTAPLVARVQEFARREQALATKHFSLMAEIAAAFCNAWRNADSGETISLTASYHCAMRQLGEFAAISIVTQPLQLVADIAQRHHGAAKPSGAGGGDVALAFFATPADASSFVIEVHEQETLRTVDLTLAAPGLGRIR